MFPVLFRSVRPFPVLAALYCRRFITFHGVLVTSRIMSLPTARTLPSDSLGSMMPSKSPVGLPARYVTHWSGTRGSGLYSQ